MLVGVIRVNLGGLKGVDNLVLHALRTHGEGALQLAQALHSGAGAGELVHLELHHFLLLLDHDGHDLVVKPSGLLGRLGLLLGGGAEGIQLLAGDAPHVADVLRSGAHVVVVVGVPQAVLDHGVHDLLVAHTGAPALGGEGVRGGGHVLGAAGHDDVGVAAQDGAGALDDALHAGAANHAHGVGGHGVGQARLHAHLAGGVLAQGGGEHTAEHQLVHLLRLHSGAVQRLLHHHGTQLRCGGVLQAAPEGAHCRPAAVDHIHFFHCSKPPDRNFIFSPYRKIPFGFDYTPPFLKNQPLVNW